MKTNLNLYLSQAHCAFAQATSARLLAALSFFMLMLIASSTSAQTKTITGIVRDDAQQGLEGVTVNVKGTSQMVLTNVDGKFSITVDLSKNDILVFSYLGKKNSEVSVADKTYLDLTLNDEPTQLIEIVVYGAGADDELYTETKSEKKRSRKSKRSF